MYVYHAAVVDKWWTGMRIGYLLQPRSLRVEHGMGDKRSKTAHV